jgi:predicted nuclease of predicted toxin-antitoxin system
LSLRLYMDEHIPAAITRALRARSVDVLTVQEDGFAGMEDPAVMDRAGALGRILVSEDEDMIRETVRRMRSSQRFAGLFRGTDLSLQLGRAIEDLALAAGVYDPEDIADRIEWIPLR